jgi:hypothetical protein
MFGKPNDIRELEDFIKKLDLASRLEPKEAAQLRRYLRAIKRERRRDHRAALVKVVIDLISLFLRFGGL